MQSPGIDDTIVAVSTGWQPACVGIVRLSGSGCADVLNRLRAALPDARPGFVDTHVRLDGGVVLPATVYAFASPWSYTGQNVVEIHTVGNLPLLRALSACLIALGARRALPGEFTARAFLNGRLDARQVEGVLALMESADRRAARDAARQVRRGEASLGRDLAGIITDLLARIEAGIDFADEEDVRFVTAGEVRVVLEQLLVDVEEAIKRSMATRRAGRPHVALAGLPNAGKSTLFNALLGRKRAIVSPVLGTTRDVLSADVVVEGHHVVMQDCAGLGSREDELELATHLAAEQTAQQADLVLWVHPANATWSTLECEVCGALPEERRMLVVSKLDLAGPADLSESGPAFGARVRVCARTGSGLAELRRRIARHVSNLAPASSRGDVMAELEPVRGALRRSLDLVPGHGVDLAMPELVALELREAVELLSARRGAGLDEEVLERVYAEFCVGK